MNLQPSLPAPGLARIAFTYGASPIMFDEARLICLTDMWKAVGSPPDRNPYQWSRLPEARGFIDDLAKNLNGGKSPIWKSRRGKHLGGTWAHWQVALAYAKYLSHEFHRYVNEAFREWAEEKADPDLKAERAIEGYRRRGHDDTWIAERLEGKLARHNLTDRLQEHEVEGVGYAACTDSINREVLGGTAREIKAMRGLPAKASTRDALKASELAGICLAEHLAAEQIQAEHAIGNAGCATVCRRAGEAVRLAFEHMRSGGDR